MNTTLDGVRVRHQELDREIEALRTERLLNGSRPWRPGPVTRGLASVGRGLISVGTTMASRVDALPIQPPAGSRGRS